MAKKKAQKNPQRGFATTSTIKKKEPEPEKVEDSVPPEAKGSAVEPPTSGSPTVAKASETNGSGNKNGVSSVQVDDWDHVAEEQQALAERVKAASEKEASKTLKVLEYEKRMSSTYPSFLWDDPTGIRDRIIELAISENEDRPVTRYPESEEKLLSRIAGLFVILRRLGFQSSHVQECLRRVVDLDLEAAMHWLYLRYTPIQEWKRSEEKDEGDVDVKPYGQGFWPDTKLTVPEPSKPAMRKIAAPKNASATPSTSTPASEAAKDGEDVSKKSGQTESSTRKGGAFFRTGSESDDDSDVHEETISPERNSSATSPKLSEEDIEDNPDAAYVTTKLRLTSLERKMGIAGKGSKKGGKGKGKPQAGKKANAAEEAEHEELEALLRRIQGLYLFNAKQAESAFATARAKLDKDELAAKLAGKSRDKPAAPDSNERTEKAAPSTTDDEVSSTQTPLQASAVATEDMGLFGNMLDEPEEQAPQEVDGPLLNEAGSLITVRDMALPKQYSGKTPRTLLDEALRRLNKYSKATYRLVYKGSRAVRAVVSIKWESSGKVEQYGMEDEACENQEQAFNYVATLALFAISTDKAVSRILPTPFRNLWDELESRKRSADSTAYDRKMAMYRNLAKGRQSIGSEAPIKSSKALDINEGAGNVAFKLQEPGSAPASEPRNQLQEGIAALQDSPAYQSMLPGRQNLPISNYRDHIVSTIEQNQVVVLCGETGCGKSTQTPTMILESELSKGQHVKIYCTEPRRISAISLAQRVSRELGEPNGSLGGRNSYIGYNIRLEARVSASTRLTYATTGILLRMLEGDTELEDVTHIIIDEVHERSIDSDFLLIILRTLLGRRKDLRVLLMSATVDAEKLSSYMGNCPVINVPGRTFPVTAYHLEDAVELSGYRLDADSDSPYVHTKQRKGRRAIQDDDLFDEEAADGDQSVSEYGVGYSKQTVTTLQAMNEHVINFDLLVSLLETICFQNPDLQRFSAAILVFMPSLETIRKLCDLLDSHSDFGSAGFLIYPLHSSISNEQQSRVFDVPRPGVRKIVVSTNIAETGVTIPDITAVIDSGRHKEMRFDEKRQISRLLECWIARSNALQRRGRAGRVQEGVCFHLFTKNRLETGLAEHPIPEMLRLSLQDLALRIKILNFSGSIENTLLQALDPPLIVNIQRAVASLIEVRALTSAEEITDLGRHLVKLPLDVYTAKLCLLASIFGCLDAALTIAATLNSKSFFVTPFGREAEADTVKRSFKAPEEYSDFMVIYRAYRLWRENCSNGTYQTFCRKHFLSHQNLSQIEELKNQYISNLIDAGFIDRQNGSTKYPKCPRIRFASLQPHLDRAADDSGLIMGCIAAAMHPKLLWLDVGGVWKTLSNSAPVAIHPSSSNFIHGRRPDFGGASFLTFFNIQQSKRLYVWENGVVPDKAVMLLSGEADVKHFANSVSIDRKIRRNVDTKTGYAIDLLRARFDEILQARLKAPAKALPEQQAKWFALLEESLRTPNEESAKGRPDRPSMAVNVVKV